MHETFQRSILKSDDTIECVLRERCNPCRLGDCPPGLFFFDGSLGFKSEYYVGDCDKMEVYCLDSGECFWGGTKTGKDRAQLIVVPLMLTPASQQADLPMPKAFIPQEDWAVRIKAMAAAKENPPKKD